MSLKKPDARPVVGMAETVPLGGDWPVLVPTVIEYMTTTAWEDGTSRETATLLVFMEDGVCKLCLNDRSTGRTSWVTGNSFEEALSSLNERLAKGTADWRDAKPYKGRKGK